MDDWGESADGLEAKLKQLNTVLSAQKRQVELAERELEEVSKEYGENSAEADRCRIKLNGYKAAVASTEKQLDNYESQLDSVNDEMDDVDSATEKATDGFTIMKGVIADLASSAIKAGIEALKDFAKYAIKAGSEFEAAMDKVQAVSRANATEMEALTAKAKEMGATTKFSATESAEAFNYMAMAGWKTDEMLNGIEGVMNLAAASGADLATTSDIVTDALTAMGYGAQDAGRFADVMAAASSNANTNVEMMGETFQYAAPIAGALGYSIEDTATAIGLMANAGIKGTKAGTALRSIMTRMSAPPKEAAAAMEELGISITTTTEDGEEVMLPFSDVIAELRDKFSGLSAEQQTQAAKAIAGQNAMAGLLAIVNASEGDFEKLTSAIQNSDGAAEEMAAIMQDNLQGAITIASSAAEGLGIALYDRVKGPLTSAVKLATELITGITEAIAPQQTALDKYLESVKATNDEAKAAVDSASAALDNGEAEVAKLEAMSSTIKEANEQFGLFAEVDVSAVADNVSETAEGVETSASDIEASAKTVTEAMSMDDVDTSNVSESLGETATDVGQSADDISTSAEEVKTNLEKIGQADLSGENLKEELHGIQTATGDAAREMDNFTKFKVKSAVMELAQSIPAIGDAWDDVTGTLQMTEQEFDNLIDAQKRSIMESALVKAQADSMEAVAKATLAQQMAQEGLNGIYEEANRLLDEYDGTQQHSISSMEELKAASDEYLVLGDVWENAADAVDEYDTATENLQSAIDVQERTAAAAEELSEQWGFTADAAEDASGATDGMAESGKNAADAASDLSDALDESGDAVEDFVTKAKEDYEIQQQMAEAHMEAAKAIVEAYGDAKEAAENAFSVNPFDAWEQDQESGIEKMQAAFDSQIEGMTNYAENLQTVSEHVGQEITPDFLQYLEGLGTDGAQAMQELADAFSEGDTSTVENLMESYTQAMQKQDEISAALAEDAVAFQMGMDEFGSTVQEWEGLEDAVDFVSQLGDGVSEEAMTAFEEAASRAQEAGVKIPDGLQEGIEEGAENPQAAIEEATSLLTAAIEGQIDGVLEIAQKSGHDIPDSVSEGIEEGGQAAVDAYNELLTEIGASGTDEAQDGGEETGEAYDEATASAMEGKKGDVEKAAVAVSTAGKNKANAEAPKWKEPGQKSGQAYTDGIAAKKSDAESAARTVAQAAANASGGQNSTFNSHGATAGSNFVSGLNGQAGNAYSAGYNVASSGDSGVSSVGTGSAYTAGSNLGQGYVNGVQDKEAAAYAAGYKVGAAGVRGINDGQKSGSPSKLTYKSGQWFVQGYVNGIASLQGTAVKAAKKLAEQAVVELTKGANWNYEEVGDKAADVFSEGIGNKLQYISDRISYTNEQNLALFDKEIEKLNAKSDKALEAEKKRTEKAQKSIKEQGEAEVKTYQETSKARIAGLEAVRDRELKDIETTRDKAVKRLQKRIDETDDKDEKKRLQKQVQSEKDKAKKRTDAVKARYKKEIDAEKASSKELVAASKANTKKRTEAEKTNSKKTQDAIKKSYDKQIAAQEKQRDAYATASEKMIQEFDAAMQSYRDKAEDLIESTINGITDKYNQKYDDLIDKQNNLIDKMKSAGELFEISGAGVMTVNDLKEQTKAITDYTSKLQKIRGLVSEELFEQITSYDMREGSAFLDRLFEMSDKELEEYNKAYTEKVQTAQKGAESLYKQDFDKVASDYQTEIKTAFDGIPAQLESLGQQAMKGFVTGLTTNTNYMTNAIKGFVKQMVDQFKKDLKISSPSKVMFGIGEYTGKGFRDGLLDVVGDIKKAANTLSNAASVPLNATDLTGIRGTILNGNQGVSGASATSVTNNYNLVQNNNSPKALSALETYQARRRQIAMVKAFA